VTIVCIFIIEAFIFIFRRCTLDSDFQFGVVGVYSFFELKLKYISGYGPLRSDTFQTLRELGNAFCFLILLEQALEIEDDLRFATVCATRLCYFFAQMSSRWLMCFVHMLSGVSLAGHQDQPVCSGRHVRSGLRRRGLPAGSQVGRVPPREDHRAVGCSGCQPITGWPCLPHGNGTLSIMRQISFVFSFWPQPLSSLFLLSPTVCAGTIDRALPHVDPHLGTWLNVDRRIAAYLSQHALHGHAGTVTIIIIAWFLHSFLLN
jgi:hypothetical protein